MNNYVYLLLNMKQRCCFIFSIIAEAARR